MTRVTKEGECTTTAPARKGAPLRAVSSKSIFAAWQYLQGEVETGIEDARTFPDAPPSDTPALQSCVDWLGAELARRRRAGFRVPKGSPK